MGQKQLQTGRWQESPGGNGESPRGCGIRFSQRQGPKDHFIAEVHGLKRRLREREDAEMCGTGHKC